MTRRIGVTLKTATSLDGRISLANGESQWITGDEARKRAHRLRADHDAVLVGAGTVRADDPLLTARLAGYQLAQPLRVVADSAAAIPLDSQLARTAGTETPVLIVAGDGAADPVHVNALRQSGLRVKLAPGNQPGASDIVDAVDNVLSEMGREPVRGQVHRILLEGGGVLAASFLAAGLVDRIEWFRAPIIIGGDGRPSVSGLDLSGLANAPRFKIAATERIGDDVLDTYVAVEEG
ncbi:MAG: RibD family protein [Pseudomonadota bacterium]